MIGKTIAELQEGDHAELTRVVHGDLTARFAAIVEAAS